MCNESWWGSKELSESNEVFKEEYMKKTLSLIMLMLFSGAVSARNVRHGLSTKFTDVMLGNMKPGMVYSIKQSQGIPYEVINMTDKEVTVEVAVEKPRERELREGFEPVPDISWVIPSPREFTLQPGEATSCDIVISVPDDEKYADRHFQAMLVTQTVEDPDMPGVAISFALASRLRFSTGPTPQEALADHRRRILDALRMDLTPSSHFVDEDAQPGEKLLLDGFDVPTLQLVNRGREEYEIEFILAEQQERYNVATGYEIIPEDFSVNFLNQKINSSPRTIHDVEMEIEVPDKEEYYGKSYAFVVLARILWLDIPVDLYARVYFKTESKN